MGAFLLYGIAMLEYVEIASKYTKERDLFDRERLASCRGARNHQKRHSVNKERSFAERKAHQTRQHVIAKKALARVDISAVRAFWRGELDYHPL